MLHQAGQRSILPMTRESVILNSCGGLECRSECLTTIYTEGPEFNPYSKKKEREKKEERGGEERK